MVQFCPECSLRIAPFDRDTRVYQGVKLHGHCFKKFWLRIDAQFHAGKPLKVRHGPTRHEANE